MFNNDFDKYWRTEALKIAMHEQLNINDELDFDALFKRAKYIYLQGYKNNIHKWDELAKATLKISQLMKDSPTEEIKQEEQPKEVIQTKINLAQNVPEHLKQCPACGELVNKNWEKHSYKSNGEKCGYAFSKE